MITQADITPEKAQELIEEYGGVMAAAEAIKLQCIGPNGRTPSASTVRGWIQLARDDRRPDGAVKGARVKQLERIAHLIEKSGFSIDDVGRVEKIKIGSHRGYIKNAKKKIEYTEDLPAESIVFTPSWDIGPAWPVVQQSKPIKVVYSPPTVIVPKGLRIEVVHPDTQIGYQRVLESREFKDDRESYAMEPMHDERAIDVACQITAAIQPDGFTHLGDLFDFSEFSRYLQVETFWRTTQASIDWAHGYLARVKAQMGPPRRRRGQTKLTPKRLRLVDGNHDWKRLGTYIQQNARAAFGLRPAMSTPESWPDLSVPHLLRLDDLGFEHFGMWPGSEAWLIEGENGLVVTHDPKKKSTYQASVISGHSHHHRVQAFTVRTTFGHRTFTHYEIGCLCSLERVKHKGSIQRTRVPSDRGFTEGWVQGLAVVEILEETGQHQVTFVPIYDGRAIYLGRQFTATSST